MGLVDTQPASCFATIADVSLFGFTLIFGVFHSFHPGTSGFLACFAPKKLRHETRSKRLFHFFVSRMFHPVSSMFHACFIFQTAVMKHAASAPIGARVLQGCFWLVCFSCGSCAQIRRD